MIHDASFILLNAACRHSKPKRCFKGWRQKPIGTCVIVFSAAGSARNTKVAVPKYDAYLIAPATNRFLSAIFDRC